MITLATLPDATAQEVFDQVVTHLRQQGKKSKGRYGCAYRSEKKDGNTLMCAAGCLISDEEYDKERMEGKDWSTSNAWIPTEHARLIKSLQFTHDVDDVEEWEEGFQSIAERHHLTYTPS